MKRTTQKELIGYSVKSYADLMKIDYTAPESVKNTEKVADTLKKSEKVADTLKKSEKVAAPLKKPKKVADTLYKKELAAFLRHTATKSFGEIYKERRGPPLKRTEKQIQSLKNWKKHCVRVYEADFKKECMLEVGGKFFMKPATIPEGYCELTAVCTKFHKQIEEELNKTVPYFAGLYKVTTQRFFEMRNDVR